MRQGQSMIRARRPFVVKNALTGLAIAGFTACVCTFSEDATGSSYSRGAESGGWR
jgi:hypothetical protein